MASPNPSSGPPSGTATPNPRFTTQASTAADLLATQTVGLVNLSDFRRRRAEALEQKEREASGSTATAAAVGGSYGRFAPASSGPASTPNGSSDGYADGGSSSRGPPPKKKRKAVAKGKLSFGVEDEAGGEEEAKSNTTTTHESSTNLPSDGEVSTTSTSAPPTNGSARPKKRIGPNTSLPLAPKALTKSALLHEAQTRETLRKEFLAMQETVKATEIIIPFVFYDGTNIPGGACKVKKGDFAWLFLDRSRKVGAELGVGGGEKAKSLNEWARVGVDDLMLVRGEIIIPHHYELYYFIVNKTLGPNGVPLFDYASTTTLSSTTPDSRSPSPTLDDYDPVSLPSKKSKRGVNNGQVTPADRGLEGINDDPNFTKVVDRRWYERNKHIFPASVWEEFDPTKDYAKGVRKDAEGNAFFFS